MQDSGVLVGLLESDGWLRCSSCDCDCLRRRRATVVTELAPGPMGILRVRGVRKECEVGGGGRDLGIDPGGQEWCNEVVVVQLTGVDSVTNFCINSGMKI